MLQRVAFQLSGKVVVLQLDNSTMKAYLCNQGGTISLFLSRLACCLLNLSDKDSLTLIPADIPAHLNVEVDYLSQRKLVPRWHLLPHIVKQLSSFGVNHRWICGLCH